MTTDPKAPLPESIETALHACGNTNAFDAYRAMHDGVSPTAVIRAHIEAQAKQVELYRNAAIDLMVMRDKAEAEIERLRGALEKCHNMANATKRIAEFKKLEAISRISKEALTPKQPAGE